MVMNQTVPIVVSDEAVEAILEGYKRSATRNSVILGTRSYSALDPPDTPDWQIFKEEVKAIVRRQRNVRIADMIARRAPFAWDVVRMVNWNTKNGFRGSYARGDQLALNVLEDRDFGRAGGFPGTSPPTGWFVSVATSGGTRLWPPTSGSVVLTVSSLPVIGHTIFGFMDPVAVPKVSTVQLVLDSDPWTEEVVDFEYRDSQGDSEAPLYELRTPWVIRPGASYRVSVRYYLTGDDKLTPIGFSVKRAVETIASIAT